MGAAACERPGAEEQVQMAWCRRLTAQIKKGSDIHRTLSEVDVPVFVLTPVVLWAGRHFF